VGKYCSRCAQRCSTESSVSLAKSLNSLKAVITTKGSLFPGTSYVAKNVGRGFKIAKVFAESQYRSTSSRTRGGQDLTSNSGYTRPSTPFDYYCSVKHQQLAIPGVFEPALGAYRVGSIP
jgi:hypothetical protein